MTLCPCPKIGNREVVRSSPKFTTYLLQSFVRGGLFTYLNGHKGRVGWVGAESGDAGVGIGNGLRAGGAAHRGEQAVAGEYLRQY